MFIRTDNLGTETPLFYKRKGLYVIRIWAQKPGIKPEDLGTFSAAKLMVDMCLRQSPDSFVRFGIG
jgi:hypothetical protein